MPSGIITFGTHIPYWRLTGETVCDALGTGSKKNARSVASYDEDTTTMALEAARAALAGNDRSQIASLTLATGAPTYGAKTNATAVHAALGLPATVSTMDVGGAERSGLAALINAMNLPGENLVVLSDVGVGPAGSPDELGLGDGAAAFVVGAADGGSPAVELLARASMTEEFLDRWKAPGDDFASTWEERFGQEIYQRLGTESVSAALSQAGIEAEQVNVHVCTGLSARAALSVAKGVGAASVVPEDLTASIGRLGVAHAGVALIDAIETAQTGDIIALTLLADGAETLVFKVGDTVGAGQAVSVRAQVAGGNDGLRYTDFLNWKGLLEKLGPRRPAPSRATAPPSHRELGWKFGFRADVCTSCGTKNLPPQRVCLRCGAVDAMEQVAMADVAGTIATFTIDHLAFSPAPPVIGVVIDFDGGGRFQCQLTDVDPNEVAIGQRVIMTFRVMSEAAGISNYFWKARPLLGSDDAPAHHGRDGK